VRKARLLRNTVLVSVVSVLAGLLEQKVAASPVRDLIGRVDVVVIGTGTARVKAGPMVSFLINVERVLKGDLQPGISLPVEWDSGVDTPLWRDSQKSNKGVWFLQNISGLWRCIPARSGMLPTFEHLFYPVTDGPLPAEIRYDSSLSVIDQVIIEVAAAEKDRENAAPIIDEAAAGYDSTEVRRAFRYLSRLATPRSKALGLAGLIQRGDVQGLQQFEAEHTSPPASPELARIVRDIDVTFRSPDPGAIQALGRLSASPSRIPGLQLAAARALAAIHTREAVPYLAALLDDPAPEVSKTAIIGMSFFANGVGIQTIHGARMIEHLNNRTQTPYTSEKTERYLGFEEKRRDEYLAFWKDWWSLHRLDFAQPK